MHARTRSSAMSAAWRSCSPLRRPSVSMPRTSDVSARGSEGEAGTAMRRRASPSRATPTASTLRPNAHKIATRRATISPISASDIDQVSRSSNAASAASERHIASACARPNAIARQVARGPAPRRASACQGAVRRCPNPK